jgi:putative ABC transport system ATP-binding protein
MIELKNATKVYRKKGGVPVTALDHVSLNVARGEFVAILGPSGSGKSTLMNVLGLLDRPDEGEYILNGRTVRDLSDDELAATRNGLIGFVFQSYHLLPRTTSLENVQLPLLYANKKEYRRLGEAALAAVGLTDRMTHFASELSGGQQQRVAIARAVVNDPPVLLADEPTGNLDSAAAEEIMRLFKKLHGNGTTIVLITHNQEVAMYADRIIQFTDGQIASDAANSAVQRTSPAAVPA